MTKSHLSLAHLTDAAVLDEVARCAREERQSIACLVAALAELDARRLYLGRGCSSLFAYCTRVLHLSEHAAYGRIEAARAARKYPVVLEMLAAGDLTLTAVGLLAPHLTSENHRDLLARAKHRTKREVEELVAAIRPLPDVRPLIRREPRPHAAAPASMNMPASGSSASPVAPPTAPVIGSHVLSDPRTTPSPTPRPIIKPLAPERYKLQMTVSRETIDTLRRVQDLLRHVVPGGDPAVIIGRALRLLLDDLEKRRMASVVRPRERADGVGTTASGQSRRSRHIPAAVRRAVWTRDGGRCAFVGAAGRCAETGFLEYHHVRPFADGGEATVENVELRCRAHNQYEADLFFGPLIARERPASFGVNSVQTEFTAFEPGVARCAMHGW